MSDDEGGQERTEEPTDKRKREAREKGQVPHSRDLISWSVLLSSAGLIWFMQDYFHDSFFLLTKNMFTFDQSIIFAADRLLPEFGTALLFALKMLAPLFILIIVIICLASVAFGGWSFNSSNFYFKGERISPLNGFKRMFSLQSLYEIVKSLFKMGLVSIIAYAVLYSNMPTLINTGYLTLSVAVSKSISILMTCVLILAASIAVIVLFDVPYQIWQHMTKLKMTQNELKDEVKETEGRPEVKSKIRQLQRQAAQRRMMEEVPKADVIITNPTHFAVALKYQQGFHRAPILVAKGTDLIALNIRKVAEENNIVILSAPPLARSLYYHADFNREIPVGLYVAVAQVLAYVFQLKRITETAVNGANAKPPEPPQDLPIPEELQK
jgi:flagellar biosynthetic protein FlhB